jgi:hypothetical protein
VTERIFRNFFPDWPRFYEVIPRGGLFARFHARFMGIFSPFFYLEAAAKLP